MSVRITDLPEGQLTANLANSVFVFVDVESDITFKIPASDMSLGGGGGTLLPWELITSNTTAVNGSRFIANTSSGSFFVTLPASPGSGHFVEIADDGNWGNTNLFIDGNGSTIENSYDGIQVDIGSLVVQFIYNGTTWQLFASSNAADVSDYGGEGGAPVTVPAAGEIGQVQYKGPQGYVKGTPTITTDGRTVVLKTYKPNRVEIGTLGVTGNFWHSEHGNLETYIVSTVTDNVITNTAYFTYNYYGSGLKVDNNNNIFVVGGNGQDKALVIKYDDSGNVIFSNTISDKTLSYVAGECVDVGYDDSVYVFTTNSDGFSDVISVITKLNANGEKQWSKSTFIGDPNGIVVEDMTLDSNNNLYFVGNRYFGNKKGIIAKLNEFGDVLFQKNVISTTSSNSQITKSSSLFLKDDYLYFSSIENKDASLNNDYQKIVIKIDETGNTIWQKALPQISNNDISFLPILTDYSNNIIALESFYNTDANLYQSIIHVLDNQGNYKKAVKLYSSTKDVQLIAGEIDTNNNFYFSGLTLNDNLNSDIILMKMNSNFEIQWKKIYGKNTENDYQYYNFGHKCLKYANNKIHLTGYTFTTNVANSEAANLQALFTAYLPDDGSLDGNYDEVYFAEFGEMSQINYAGYNTTNANVLITDDLFFDGFNLNLNINVDSEIITINSNTANANIDNSNTSNISIENTNVFFNYIEIKGGPDPSYFLPNKDGTAGQALVTDGKGNVYWKSVNIHNEPFQSILILDWDGRDIIRMSLVDDVIITMSPTAFDGQKCILELKQPPNGNASVTFTDEVRFSISIPYFTATTEGNKTDKIGFIYNAVDDKYDVVAISMGH